MTALHVAVQYGHRLVAALLLRHVLLSSFFHRFKHNISGAGPDQLHHGLMGTPGYILPEAAWIKPIHGRESSRRASLRHFHVSALAKPTPANSRFWTGHDQLSYLVASRSRYCQAQDSVSCQPLDERLYRGAQWQFILDIALCRIATRWIN